MGSGKTSWAIQYLNDHPAENILFITLFLNETDRIQESTGDRFYLPEQRGHGKLGNMKELLENESDIASTHALFLMFDTECIDILREREYTLFLDESVEAVKPFIQDRKDDIKYLIEKGDIVIGEKNALIWTGNDDLDFQYNKIRSLCKKHCLFQVDNKFYTWQFPPEIFELFKKTYVMTYRFDSSPMRCYFDLYNIRYTKKSLCKVDNEKYRLIPYRKPDISRFQQLIKIYTDTKSNSIAVKRSALSKSWFNNGNNCKNIKTLKDRLYNFFRNKSQAKGNEIIWTTFKDCKGKLKGKGFSDSFLACNCKATNDYADRKYLAYCLNFFMNPEIKKFFQTQGIKVDEDGYALSEMIQWIWRSRIRKGESIVVYIPAKRMRDMFVEWLNGEQ